MRGTLIPVRCKALLYRLTLYRVFKQTYLHWIKQFILFHDKRHPALLGSDEIGTFLTHLAVKRAVSASTQNQALAALLFLYKQVLQIDLPRLENVARAKKPIRLPVVLTRDEVKAVLCQLILPRPSLARSRHFVDIAPIHRPLEAAV